MPQFGHFGSKFSKTNVSFEISTFKIGCRQNFVKIRKLTLFGPKFGLLGLKFEKRKLVENSRFPQCGNVGSFRVVFNFFFFGGRFGWFWVVSTGFSLFRVISGCFISFRVLLRSGFAGHKALSCVAPDEK